MLLAERMTMERNGTPLAAIALASRPSVHPESFAALAQLEPKLARLMQAAYCLRNNMPADWCRTRHWEGEDGKIIGLADKIRCSVGPESRFQGQGFAGTLRALEEAQYLIFMTLPSCLHDCLCRRDKRKDVDRR